jgi:transposase
MTMSRRKTERQSTFWIAADALPTGGGHPFYQRMNAGLAEQGFDDWVHERCEPYYASGGAPGLSPAIYFRCLMVGYFEGIDSERGIAWRVEDSFSLRQFLGIDLTEATPFHSTISRTRQRLPVEVHGEVFQWILGALYQHGLIEGRTLGIDATTLEANAAMRSIVRRDTGETYEQYLTRLAEASGVETPSKDELARFDKHRKNKASNADWRHPHDPDAKVTKMKDGRTHLAHKCEHGVDLATGAVLSVTLHDATTGDTTSWRDTFEEAATNGHEGYALGQHQQEAETPEAAYQEVGDEENDDEGTGLGRILQEVVADKGYHSNDTMTDMREMGARSYVSEPDRGKRHWKNKREAQEAVYANRRRMKSERGKCLRKKRGELIERSFAHTCETGAMRRTHLRGHENILKRLLIHVGAFNLGLLRRRVLGVGTPKGLQGLAARFLRLLTALLMRLRIAQTALHRLRSFQSRAEAGLPGTPAPGNPYLVPAAA